MSAKINKNLCSIFCFIFLSAGCGEINKVQLSNLSTNTPVKNTPDAFLNEPLVNALTRVTKKPFSIYITPKNSPVSPEKFTGYHTGVDFEILSGEENSEINVSAVCGGKIILKKWTSGYGGVLVEACNIQNQDVTVVYGHLNLNSISAKVGEALEAGKSFAILGKGFSKETDGERKHLHLGIHKGASMNLKGYVQDKEELLNWLDAEKLLK